MSTPVPVVRFTFTDLGSGGGAMIPVSHRLPWRSLRLTLTSKFAKAPKETGLTTISARVWLGVVVQFAQKHPPCHSETGFIGEESACCQQRDSRFLARRCCDSE